MASGGGSTAILATATGNPLSFVTDMVRPLKSLVIPFTPIQAAGTPSPSNILPISGWTGCNIVGTNKNVFTFDSSKRISNKNISADLEIVDNNYYDVVTGVPLKGGATYTFSNSVNQNDSGAVICLLNYNHNGDKVERIVFPNKSLAAWSYTIELPAYIEKVDMSLVKRRNTNAPFSTLQIELGSTATSYQQGQETVIPITFTDPTTGDPMTVYGGTLTLNEDGSADVVSTWERVKIKNLAFTISSYASHPFTSTMYYQNKKPGKYNFLASIYKHSSESIANMPDLSISGLSNSKILYIKDDRYSTVAEFQAAQGEIDIIYESNDAITYHFDNVGQLITFLGTNTIWTDTNGTNIATYLKHQS